MTLARPDAFFGKLRAGLLGPSLDTAEVAGVNAILAAMEGLPVAYVAYALGTAYLETAHSMQPIREFGGPAYFFRHYDIDGSRPDIARRLGNTEKGDGCRFCGRGYVQLTGRANYAKAGHALGVDLLADPDRAMGAEVAAQVMRHGMLEGWFTGRKLADYLPDQRAALPEEFIPARRIINGQDRAVDIANAAMSFQSALQLGQWA